MAEVTHFDYCFYHVFDDTGKLLGAFEEGDIAEAEIIWLRLVNPNKHYRCIYVSEPPETMIDTTLP